MARAHAQESIRKHRERISGGNAPKKPRKASGKGSVHKHSPISGEGAGFSKSAGINSTAKMGSPSYGMDNLGKQEVQSPKHSSSAPSEVSKTTKAIDRFKEARKQLPGDHGGRTPPPQWAYREGQARVLNTPEFGQNRPSQADAASVSSSSSLISQMPLQGPSVPSEA